MTRVQILVVEDENLVAESIRNMLTGLGYQVLGVVASGEEAVAKVGESLPDLVLMDIRLKGEMDGIEAANQIRDRYGTPVVYLTAYADEKTLQRAKVSAPLGYVLKPFKIQELRTAIEMALYKSEMDRKLMDSQERLTALVESAPTGIVIVDGEGRINAINARVQEMFGYLRAELVNQPIEMLLPERFRQVHPEHRSSYMLAPESRPMGTDLDLFGRRKDGSEFPIEVGLSHFETGAGIMAMSFVSDVTERRAVEQQVQWLARFPDENPRPVLRVRNDGVVLYANRAGTPLLALWQCEVGQRLPQEWSAFMMGAFEDGQSREVEVGYGERVFSLAVAPIQEAGYLNVYGQDITERKRAEEQLRKLSRAVEQSPSSVVITDPDGHIEYVNPKFFEITGYLEEDVLGQNPRLLKSGEQATSYYEGLWKTVLDGGEWRGEFSNRRKDGRVYWESASISPIKNTNGEITHFVKVAEDITEHKRVDAALREYAAELEARNEELDAFAHTVAHDLKNPLSLILGFAEILEMDTQPSLDAKTRKYLRLIAKSGRKMSNIIEELLLLAGVRKVNAPLAPVDMTEVVFEAQHRVADMAEEHKAVIVAPDEWPWALGYAPWVEEVWVNYLSNALKYGGHPPLIELGAEEQSDGMIRFWVRDNGQGLTSGDQAQLFTPFQQLDKTRAQGHGLGLSIVRRIVRKLGGKVGVESAGVAGQGSTFFFTLPGVGI